MIYSEAFQTKPAAYTIADFSTPAQLIDRILLERDRELAFEGQTRTTNKDRKGTERCTLNNDKKILPVPDYENQISSGKNNPKQRFQKLIYYKMKKLLLQYVC